MPRFDVTTIGEAILRYSVPAGQRLEAVARLDVHAGGTEANVVTLLSRLGWRCAWHSALPDNPLGRLAAARFRESGLDLFAVRWAEGRMALYYVEFAAPPRPTQVYFDRAGTPFTHLTPEDIDWDALLDTRLLHLSGLSAALSPSARAILLEAARRAKARGVSVSLDVNYRERLWSPETARDTLAPLVEAVDVLFCSRADARRVFSITGQPEQIIQGLRDISGAWQIVVSLSAEGVAGWDGERYHHLPAHPVTILDRIGAGDALAGGVLHGWLQGDFARGMRYGVLAAALALSQHGDQVITTRVELEALLELGDEDIQR